MVLIIRVVLLNNFVQNIDIYVSDGLNLALPVTAEISDNFIQNVDIYASEGLNFGWLVTAATATPVVVTGNMMLWGNTLSIV